jgi:hypothetical protein
MKITNRPFCKNSGRFVPSGVKVGMVNSSLGSPNCRYGADLYGRTCTSTSLTQRAILDESLDYSKVYQPGRSNGKPGSFLIKQKEKTKNAHLLTREAVFET